MMKIWDISLPVSPGLPVWPGEPEVTLERIQSLSKGDQANVSQLACGVHMGTHVDAPIHFVENGLSAEKLSLEQLIGPAMVVELLDVDAITPDHLEGLGLAIDTTRLLFKTNNSSIWANPNHKFHAEFVALTPEAATWLIQRGIRLVGVDYLSVQGYHDAAPWTHRILLEAEVVIVEGLNLQQVAPGNYRLVCLPLKLVGSDGAPARAVLVKG